MPPRITRVRWKAAGEIPFGLDFDERTGTFTGEPEEAGEYVIPVSVETNYGKDTKDVTIIIEDSPYSVYAIGSKAATWSGGAEPDEEGFYPIPIPRAYRLTEHMNGFGAKTAGGAYYFCGVKAIKDSRSGEIGSVISNISTPEIMTIGDKNVDEVRIASMRNYTYTIRNTTTGKKDSWTYQGYCMITRYGGNNVQLSASNVRLYYDYELSGQSGTSWYTDHSIYPGTSKSNLYKLPEARTPLVFLNGGVYMLFNGGSEVWTLSFDAKGDNKWYLGKKDGLDFTNVKKFFQPYENEKNGACSAHAPLFSYLSEDNLLDGDEANFSNGTIKNAWVYMNKAYVQTDNDNLYEKQGTASWNYLGYFDVKKMVTTSVPTAFLLTQDGRLYHKGAALDGITEKHTLFTQIFPNSIIHDITYGGNTLTVTKE